MPHSDRKIVVRAFGNPIEAAEFQDNAPAIEPDVGKVLVHTEFVPINPADLNVLEGRYGRLPDLPAVIGNEGAGRIAALGEGVTEFAVGDQVIYLNRSDCWQDHVLARPDELLRVPPDLDPQLAAMLKVNPVTGWLLLHENGTPEPGGWIVQNAANSGVGQAVIAIAKANGWHTANFVRREELIAPLLEAGADLVALDNDDGKTAMLEAIGEAPISLALNAVGGESALRLMSMLAKGGTHVTYGAMGRQPLKVPNSFLIFKGLRIVGLWLTQWLGSAGRDEVERIYAELAELMLSGELPQPVDSVFSPDQIKAAIARASEGKKSGKVLLDFRGAGAEGKSDG